MITESMLPMILVPVTFLFVLLIILIAKAPKAGAWVVGGLILLVPILLYRLAMSGALRQEEAAPLVALPLTFLFVLLVILLAKAPKAGAGLVIALVVMGLSALMLWPLASRQVAYQPRPDRYPVAQVGLTQSQQTESNDGSAAADGQFDRVYSEFRQQLGSGPVPPALPPVVIPQVSIPPEPAVVSPIWSEGVENEFEADICPSKAAAARALGARAYRVIRELPRDGNAPSPIILFQQEQNRILVVELKNALQGLLPGRVCTIEAEMRNLQPGEIGVALQFVAGHENYAPWAKASGAVIVTRGDALVNIFAADRRTTVQQSYTEKPWVENFSAFTGERPEMHFIVTRSRETCTSESEARQQALNDARARLTEALGARSGRKFGPAAPPITGTDVLQGGFIVDQFAQSFNGTAGKIWREAMLLDVSAPKLSRLAELKLGQLHAQKMSWARMGFSALGVVVLIGVIYFFLNMATMGYYEWSLRIAGAILAIVAVLAILMVVH
jgi:hypothetical protein